MVSLTWALCQSCELTSQLTQQIHDRKLPSSHRGGTRKLRQCGLTSGQWWNCGKNKEASHTQTWLLKRSWKKRQKCSREWPVKQKTGSGKASVTLSTETQHSLTSGNSTDRWRAALRTPTPPTSQMPADQYWRQARKRAQHYSNASSSRAIRTIWMKGKQSGKGWTEPWQRPARMTTWSQSWNSPKHFPDWARIQLLVLTGSNTQTLRTCQYITRASSSDCTKKASQQDRFPRTGLIVTSSQSQNRQKTIANWTDTVSSRCRTQRESWWNGLWPGSLLRT